MLNLLRTLISVNQAVGQAQYCSDLLKNDNNANRLNRERLAHSRINRLNIKWHSEQINDEILARDSKSYQRISGQIDKFANSWTMYFYLFYYFIKVHVIKILQITLTCANMVTAFFKNSFSLASTPDETRASADLSTSAEFSNNALATSATPRAEHLVDEEQANLIAPMNT